MPRDPRALLWDEQQAGLAIQAFTEGMDAQTYARPAMAQASVERKFEVIGKALIQLSKFEPSRAARIPELKTVVAFRNVLIHGYATVDPQTVWNTVQTSLPNLLATVSILLTESGTD